ncbi:hypothetical protein [Acrocarpospora catenulata]|uniref:hypothetical protein n=1 Tax=Acrocarpospora catenulata TaxID=2836182 RepID=UPI001BDAEBCB|nr:hypothetical protein [Acrocarpospora catenulata]
MRGLKGRIRQAARATWRLVLSLPPALLCLFGLVVRSWPTAACRGRWRRWPPAARSR